MFSPEVWVQSFQCSRQKGSAEGAKGYRASFQSKWLASDGAAGGTRHWKEIRTWLEIRLISASEEAIWFYLEERKNLKQKYQKFVAYCP